MNKNKNPNKTQNILLVTNIIQAIIITTLVIVLLVSIGKPKQTTITEVDYNKLKEAINNTHPEAIVTVSGVDYDKIKEVVIENQEKVDYDKIKEMIIENQEKVDYDKIVEIMKETEKDFGEKFEDMTEYFGEQFKGLIEDVNKELNP